MKKILSFLVLMIITSCTSYESYYKLDSKYLERRTLETREFNTENEESIIIASAQVLQDLGFNIEESEINLGLITASKDRHAGSTAGTVALVFLAALGGTQAVYDVNQKIYATLVSTKNKNNSVKVRIVFARAIWNNMNQVRFEKITDVITYLTFFDKLSQSVFLTANNI